MRPEHKRPQSTHGTVMQSGALARMHGGMRRCATQIAYEDVGDGAVVEPDEADAAANGDDAADVAGLRTHAKV